MFVFVCWRESGGWGEVGIDKMRDRERGRERKR